MPVALSKLRAGRTWRAERLASPGFADAETTTSVTQVSQLVANLNRLTKKGEPWVWGPAQQAAHGALKAVFNRDGIVLHRIEYNKRHVLHTDFSNRG